MQTPQIITSFGNPTFGIYIKSECNVFKFVIQSYTMDNYMDADNYFSKQCDISHVTYVSDPVKYQATCFYSIKNSELECMFINVNGARKWYVNIDRCDEHYDLPLIHTVNSLQYVDDETITFELLYGTTKYTATKKIETLYDGRPFTSAECVMFQWTGTKNERIPLKKCSLFAYREFDTLDDFHRNVAAVIIDDNTYIITGSTQTFFLHNNSRY